MLELLDIIYITVDDMVDYNVLFISTALTISFFYVTQPENKIK
jgi:hypothetical protein